MYWEGSVVRFLNYKTIFCKSHYFHNPTWFF